MYGSMQSSGSPAPPLLNMEAVLTAVIAWVVFRENADRRIVLGLVAIVAGGKGLAAGMVNTLIALSLGSAPPNAATVFSSLAAGLFGYGLGLVLFVLALRGLGTARTGAYFSTAPFIGAALGMRIRTAPPLGQQQHT